MNTETDRPNVNSCVCVCEREREREKISRQRVDLYLVGVTAYRRLKRLLK